MDASKHNFDPRSGLVAHRPPDFAPAAVSGEAATITLNASLIMRSLVAAFGVLLLLHLVVVAANLTGTEFRGMQRLYFDDEHNLPSLFSAFNLFVAAVLLAVIARFKRLGKDRFAMHWAVLSVIFFGLSVDEALSFHEILIDPLRNAFGLSGLLRLSWVVAGAVFLAVFAFFFFRFWLALPPRPRLMFMLAGSGYVLGALGMEMLGGPRWEELEAGGSTAPYMLVMTIEETLEMTSIMFFIHALLQYLKGFKPDFQVRIQ